MQSGKFRSVGEIRPTSRACLPSFRKEAILSLVFFRGCLFAICSYSSRVIKANTVTGVTLQNGETNNGLACRGAEKETSTHCRRESEAVSPRVSTYHAARSVRVG